LLNIIVFLTYLPIITHKLAFRGLEPLSAADSNRVLIAVWLLGDFEVHHYSMKIGNISKKLKMTVFVTFNFFDDFQIRTLLVGFSLQLLL